MAGAAVPYTDGARVVHIGLAKTGTTGLQAALHAARPLLEEHGVHFVGRRRHSRKAARFAIDAAEPWQVNGDKQWRRLCDELRTSDARVAFYSSETLAVARPDQVPRIVEQLGGDLQILVTLRPLAPLLASAWQQALRRGVPVDLATYLHDNLPADDTEGSTLWNRRFSEHVRIWGEAVGGTDRVTLLVPDPSDRSSLLQRTEELLGLPPRSLPTPERDNSSLPYAEATLLSHFNAAYRDAGGDPTVWRTTSSYRGETPLSGIPAGPDPRPITLPRWAATRCNALTERWIGEVDATEARVVGDLTHLYVDERAHPEQVAPPERVSLETAAELTRIFALAALRTESPGGADDA